VTRRQEIPWTRIAVEATAIVASILLAFSIDAWWGEHQEREHERQLLGSLLAEFNQNRVELDRALNSFTVSRKSVTRVLMFAGQNLGDDDKDVIGQNVFTLFDYWTFDPSTGAIDSLLNAGQLNLIQNLELRTRLAGWSGLVSDYKEEERELDYVAFREFGPYYKKIAPLRNVDEISPGLFQSQWQGAINDVEFLNHLGQLSYILESNIIEASDIGREIDLIITLIATELEQ